MAKGFSDTNGQAKKGGKYYKWVDGEQVIRLVGDIVPRYVYWKNSKDGDGKSVNTSIECLSFDRDAEKFTNVEKDWFRHYFPDQNCSWAYVARSIDPSDSSKTILIPMKKKLYAQIQEVAEELGDPTDIETGWDCIIERKKTGPQAFNVEYTLKQLKCTNRPLGDEERAAVLEMDPIDDLVPRQTPEEQKEFIEKTWFSDTDTNVDTTVQDEFDDIPY